MFCKKSVLRNEACNFNQKETLVQAFSCEFCEISKNTSGGCFSIWTNNCITWKNVRADHFWWVSLYLSGTFGARTLTNPLLQQNVHFKTFLRKWYLTMTVIWSTLVEFYITTHKLSQMIWKMIERECIYQLIFSLNNFHLGHYAKLACKNVNKFV